MRTHQNFVESLPAILIFLLAGGLVFPKATMYIGFANVIARPVYGIGYSKFGPAARMLGAVAGGLPLYCLGLVTFVRIVMMAASY